MLGGSRTFMKRFNGNKDVKSVLCKPENWFEWEYYRVVVKKTLVS